MRRPVPALARALIRWQHVAGAYWPYVCAAPFNAEYEGSGQETSPATLSNRPGLISTEGRATQRTRAGGHAHSDVARLLIDGIDAGTTGDRVAVFVDLPAVPSIAMAPAFCRSGIHPVPIIQRWVAEHAILPCEALVDALITVSLRVVRPTLPRGAAFLLDGDRAGPLQFRAEGATPAARFDNRYGYPLCRFPSPGFLHARGITAVYWCSAGGVAADLEAYAELLTEAGLAPCAIGTSALA